MLESMYYRSHDHSVLRLLSNSTHGNGFSVDDIDAHQAAGNETTFVQGKMHCDSIDVFLIARAVIGVQAICLMMTKVASCRSDSDQLHWISD